jgi:hypothetical protein
VYLPGKRPALSAGTIRLHPRTIGEMRDEPQQLELADHRSAMPDITLEFAI